MEQVGMVSLWAGRADSARALNAYLQAGYTEDGDYVPSSFAKYFGIGYYDDDCLESRYRAESSRNVSELLKGHSYDAAIIEALNNLIGFDFPLDVNAVVLLYDFRHDSGVEAGHDGTVRLRYMGAVAFSKIRP